MSLSLKATQEDPWRQFARQHEVGDVIEGRVTKLVPFGAFVEVDDAIEGLVHISELADHHVERAEDEVGVHDRVEVKIIDIDLDRRRISLSRKQAMAPTTDEAGVPVGEGTSVAIEDAGDVDEAAPVSEMELETEADSGMEFEAESGDAEDGRCRRRNRSAEVIEEAAEPLPQRRSNEAVVVRGPQRPRRRRGTRGDPATERHQRPKQTRAKRQPRG